MLPQPHTIHSQPLLTTTTTTGKMSSSSSSSSPNGYAEEAVGGIGDGGAMMGEGVCTVGVVLVVGGRGRTGHV